MTRRNVLMLVMLLQVTFAWAQKEVYIPWEWRNFNPKDTLLYAEEDPDNKYMWSKTRSKSSDNVIIFWDKWYGSTSPSDAPEAYRVDIDDFLEKCEQFYDVEVNKIGFGSKNLEKYKVLVCMNHTTGWICYGGGYDFQVSALWLSPSTSKPTGSAVAHELGHAFHYMCYGEDSNYGATAGIETGFHSAVGNGATIWETTANWQSLQSYPDQFLTMSYIHLIFPKSHNYAFTHEWQRYQSFPFMQYICEYYNDMTTVAQVWKQHETTVKDFNECLMDLKGLSVEELYKLHFDYAMHVVTWDFDILKDQDRTPYIGNYLFNYVKLANNKYQVALSSCPQSTGFNVIPLKVPEAGTNLSTTFTALIPGSDLAEGDPAQFLDGGSQYASSGRTQYFKMSRSYAARRGFRLGYVALMNDGSTRYFSKDTIYCKKYPVTSVDYGMELPEGVSRLWLVVSPTPSTYFQHKWDDTIDNDDQWPYQVSFSGTDILGESDVVLTKDHLNVSAESISDISEVSDGKTAFVLQNKATGQYMYFTDAKEVARYGELISVKSPSTNGFVFKLEKPRSASGVDANDYVFKVYDGDFNRYVNWDGSNNCLNMNPTGSVIFCLANTGTNGRDMTNGGVWDVAYDETEQAFVLKNIALKKYLAPNAASSTPDYWYIKPTFISYDSHDVDVAYNTIIDCPMDSTVKAEMMAKQAEYKASSTPDNLTAYGDAVVAAQKAAEDWASAITEVVSEPARNNNRIYNLNGQIVKNPSKGIYIINGKKVMIGS